MCRTHLARSNGKTYGCIGLHYGGLFLMRKFPTIPYGFCSAYISDNVVKLTIDHCGEVVADMGQSRNFNITS